ncbi:MAG TPA: hypothetical protein V6D29_24830 [Leptolyngbyaceae cyanobacterium]
MKKHWFLAVCATLLLSCNSNSSQEPVAAPPSPTPTATSAAADPLPQVDSLTFGEIDLSGCGMTLYASGSNPLKDGFYLFSGFVDPEVPPKADGSMRMKLNGEIVNFTRTATSGEAIPGGQFTFQTFVSEDNRTTVTVETSPAVSSGEPEANGLPEATITVTRDGQETTVDAVGDTGC